MVCVETFRVSFACIFCSSLLFFSGFFFFVLDVVVYNVQMLFFPHKSLKLSIIIYSTFPDAIKTAFQLFKHSSATFITLISPLNESNAQKLMRRTRNRNEIVKRLCVFLFILNCVGGGFVLTTTHTQTQTRRFYP